MADIDDALGYGEDDMPRFHFSRKARKLLDDLQKKIGAPSRIEVMRYALNWLDFTIEELKQGHNPCLECEDGIMRVRMPHTEEGFWDKE